MESFETRLQSADGHRFELRSRVPAKPAAALLWLPALGIAARHYQPFAESRAARGVAVFVPDWRGHGSSNLRASRDCDWGYRELLEFDLAASEAGVRQLLAQRGLAALPRILGGHSLGGQLASCRLAMAPGFADRLWLVASGAPYWRSFPPPTRYWLPLAYRFLPWLAHRRGSLPGRRIGFGGNEARGVIADWARTALSGRYAAHGLGIDFESALSRTAPEVRAVVLTGDWLAPASSLRFLLSKMPGAASSIHILDDQAVGGRADHFHWMERPAAVAAALAG